MELWELVAGWDLRSMDPNASMSHRSMGYGFQDLVFSDLGLEGLGLEGLGSETGRNRLRWNRFK